MRPEEVRERLNELRGISGDPETAHMEEDNLYQEVLTAIADGTCEDPAECARLALMSQEIDFPRWCA